MNDTTKKRLNEEKAYEFLRAELLKILQWFGKDDMTDDTMNAVSTECVIDLRGADSYEDCVLTSQQEAILAEWENVQAFQGFRVVRPLVLL